MDTQYRAAASARSAWWRSTADALGIQHPLVTLRCTPAGGGELITWFADGADAVAALTMALQLPAPAEGVRLDAIAPTVAAAVAATYTSAAPPPAVALRDGVPAAMVESWPTPAALLASVVSAAESSAAAVTAEVAAMRRASADRNHRMAAASSMQTASMATTLSGGGFPTHYINGVPSYSRITF